jgi:Magnesium chelatase, subunit ChlI
VAIARANHRVTYPARFMLVAAMNPCRCGRAAEPGYACRRGLNARCTADYQACISGPLLDRIDLHIEVPAVTAADLILPPPTEGSREVAERVALARERQAARYAAIGLPHIRSNATVSGACSRTWRGRTGAGYRCCAKRPMRCGFPRAAIIACCAWRARSPISTAPTKSAASTSPKPCPIARSPTRSDARLRA